MNILLINHYAGSPERGMEFRPYYFAREWVRLGHKVDIIAASYSHIRRVNPAVRKDFQTETPDGIRYHWIKTVKYDRNGVRRALTMAQFAGKLWLNAKRIARELEPDAVICSSTYPMDTYAGQRIRGASEKKAILIHEVHDMWPVSLIESGEMAPGHPFIRVVQAAENSFCRNADAVVSLLPAAKDYFAEHGMDPKKFHHIPNGIVLDEWENYQKIPEDLAGYFRGNREKGIFNLCFFGTVQKTYNLEVLISAVKKLRLPNLTVTFIGPGMDREYLKNLAAGYEDIFRFYDPIPKKSMPDLFNYIDASFVGAKSSKILRFGICMNKLFDAMMGGKPILYMADAPNNYIEQFRCGITVRRNDEAALSEAICRLLALPSWERDEMGKNGREAVIREFNYPCLAAEFLDVIKRGLNDREKPRENN